MHHSLRPQDYGYDVKYRESSPSPASADDRTLKFEPYEFEIALTLDPIGCDVSGEPSGSITEYKGDIQLSDAEYDGRKLFGRVEFLIAHFNTNDPSWVLDYSRATVVYLELFDECFDLSEQTRMALRTDYPGAGPMLIFDRLEILPEARGAGLGLAVLERIIGKFGLGCMFAALKSFPLQLEFARTHPSDGKDDFERRMALDRIPGKSAEAHRRLARYYRRAKFRPVKGKHLMVRNLG